MTLLHSLRIPAVFWPRESVLVAEAAGSGSDVADLEHRLFASYVDALVGYARRGLLAIGETIIMNDVDWSAVQDAQCATPIVIVRLVCSLPVLVQREQLRGTTHPGTAVHTVAREFDVADYDLTIDTESEAPDAAAAAVMAAASRSGLGLSTEWELLEDPSRSGIGNRLPLDAP